MGLALTYYSLLVLLARGSHAFARNLVGSGQGALQHAEAATGQDAATNVPSFLLAAHQHQHHQHQQQQQEGENQELEEAQNEEPNGEQQHPVQEMVDAEEAAALLSLEEKAKSGEIAADQLKGAVESAFSAFIQQTENNLKSLEEAVAAVEAGRLPVEAPSFLAVEEGQGDTSTLPSASEEENADGADAPVDAEAEEEGDEELGARTKGTWDETKEQAKETMEEVKDRVREWDERLSTLVGNAKQDAKKAARKLKDAIVEGVDKAKRKMRRGWRKFIDNMHHQLVGADKEDSDGEAAQAATDDATGERGGGTEDERLKRKLFGGGLHPPEDGEGSEGNGSVSTADGEGRSGAEGESSGKGAEFKLADALQSGAPGSGGDANKGTKKGETRTAAPPSASQAQHTATEDTR